MALTTKEISNLVVSMFDAAAGAANLTSLESYVATQAPTYSLADLANDLAMSPLYTEQYNGMDNAAKADALASQFGLTKNMFGLYDTQEEQDAYNFFKDSLDAGSTTQDLQVAALTYLSDPANAASFPVASATLANKEAVAQYYSITQGHSAATVADLQAVLANVTDSSASVTDAEAAIDSAVGQTFNLNDGVDNLIGTALNDTFNANLNQSAQMGGVVANTLATGDSIDGGAGTDTLSAQLTDQANWYNNETDVQPMTTSVENVQIEAQDYTQGGGSATLDAKNMTGVDKIGSYYSDGDLVIENLTTLTDNNTIRNTSDLTVTMDHTDNFDHDGDASDLTVLFDQDYLVTGKTTSGAQLTVRMENAVENVNGGNSIAKFDSLVFSVGGTNVTVDLTAIAADTTLTPATAYAAVVNAINAQLAADGFTTVSAALAPIENSVFSIPVAGHAVGDSAGQYYPIVITNSGPELLAGVNIVTAADASDTDLNNSFSAIDPTTNTNPVSINVELDKVGRDGEGGNLNIGAKQSAINSLGTDVSKHNGIDQFNITVKGDAARPSNLGTITSTNGTLNTVNIASETRDDDSYAALTVRGIEEGSSPFGGTLTTLNANSFLGDLYIGQVTAAQNIDTFTATGGGDVTLYENISGIDATVTTGAGADNLNIAVSNGSVGDALNVGISSGAGADTVNVTLYNSTANIDSGAGDDTVTVAINSLSSATVDGNSGNDTITVTGAGSATLLGGSGNDVIRGNGVAVSVTDGSGDDVVYVQNTETQAVQTLATTADSDNTDTLGSINQGAHDPVDYELMYGRSVQVTIAAPNTASTAANPYTEGFESGVVAIHTAGAISTLDEYNAAILKAINDDPVLSHLAVASVVGGNVQVDYLVDGVVSGPATVHVDITSPTYTTSSQAIIDMQNAFITRYPDSTITAQEVLDAYNGVSSTLDSTQNTAGTAGTTGTANDVTLSAGNDFIALSSERTDTVKFDAHTNIGHDTIVNFDIGDGNGNADALDFTAFLQDMQDASSNTNHLSATRIATSIAVDNAASINLTSNEVAIVNDFSGTSTDTWDAMTASNVDTALTNNSTSYANIADGATTLAPNAYQATQESILMVENDQNAGEYKVFEVTETTATNDYAVTLIGTVDFGHEIDATAHVV